MPDFRYVDASDRIYNDPQIGPVSKGDVRTLRKAPDQHWERVSAPTAHAKPRKSTTAESPTDTAEQPTTSEE